MSTTLTGLVVNADTATVANCVMNRTGLKFASTTAADACGSGGAYSGDGILDAGEDATLPVTLSNPGSVAATSVQGTIATSLPGVTITQATASFADVPGGGSGSSASPHFHFTVAPGMACGTVIPFTIHLTAAQGSWDDTFNVTVGQPVNGATTTLMSESFDGATFPPSGWAQVDTSGTAGNWARSTNTVHPSGGGTHSGAGLAYFNSYTSASGSQTRLYRTSGVAIPSTAVSAAVTFWMYHDTNLSSDNDRLQLQVSTNGGGSWTNVGSAVSRVDGSTGWKQHTIPLSSYIGQSGIQVAFLGISVFGYDCHIDDVQVTSTAPSTCTMHACSGCGGPPPEATDLVADANKSAYSWSLAAGATEYDVARGPVSGLPVGSAGDEACFGHLAGPSIVDATTPDPGTAFWYLARGRNACGAGNLRLAEQRYAASDDRLSLNPNQENPCT
jgi:hypothetical protein